MKKQLSFFFAMLFLLILFSQSVESASPFSLITTGEDLQIRTPGLDVLKNGQDNSFPIHVFNSSNGAYVTSNTDCFFHLYNSSSSHLLSLKQNTTSFGFDYEFLVLGGNLTTGSYFVNYQCNSTNGLSGATRYDFQVTPSGHIPTTAQGLLYGLLILASMFFLAVCLYGAFTIDGKNEFSMGGDLINVNFNKYYKGFLFLIAYLFAIFTSYLAWQVSSQFLLLDLGTAIFKTLFNILWIGVFPIMILLIIVGFVKWFADVELHRLAERGLKPR
jgi:hypothetical protein